MTAAKAETMFSEIMKGQDTENPTVAPEFVSNLITGCIAGADGVDPDALNRLGQALTDVFSLPQRTLHHRRRTMRKPCNEQLCALAQKGDAHAADLLLEHNSGFIRKTASEIFLKSNLAESDLSIEPGDLEQEGCIGLLKAISSYDKSVGVKFLTYAAPFIRNAMTDLVRDAFSRYEQRMVDSENGLGLQKSGWMKFSPAKSDCCAWRRLPTSPPNLRNRFMRKEKPCGSCTRAWGKSPSGNRRIFCTAMALRTILGTR